MKVYLVFDEDDPYCGNGYLSAVFDSREKAEKFIKSYQTKYSDFYVEEREVL